MGWSAEGPAGGLAVGLAGGLAGVRVLDFSSDIAGPYATKLLADGGADVVKVEKPDGDPMRIWSASEELGLRGGSGNRQVGSESGLGGEDRLSGESAATATPGEAGEAGEDIETAKALFCYLNASKRSVIGEPQDEHIQRLLSAAHIVVEDFPPAESKSIDFAGKFPHLVVCSITPYGRDGPLADAPWTEFTVQAECGSTAFRGRPDQPPIQAGGRVTDFTAGAYAAPAIAAALALAHQTGQGRHIDFSIAEAGIISLAIYSDVAQQMHKDRPFGGPTRSVELPSIEPTKDGWVGFNTNTGQQAENFLVLIERFDLLESGEWTGPASYGKRMENIDLWNSFVHEWTTKHTTAEIVEKAVELRIPVAPVHSGESVFAEEHFLERGVFVENPAGFQQPRPAYLLTSASGQDLGLPAPLRLAPKLGEHTEEVMSEWLGGESAEVPGAEAPGADASEVEPSGVESSKAEMSRVEAPDLFGAGDFAMDGGFVELSSGAGLAAEAGSGAEVGSADASSPIGSPAESRLPFAGFRIVDLTSWWAGPSATQLFAFLGAEVIHIESGTHPDGMRMTGAMFGQPEWWEWGHMFMSANTNKLGVTLDLETAEGHDLLCRLVAKSDAVVENFSPRVAEKFGLSFEFLRSLNRRIVYMRMPAFGLSGPWRERVGFAQTMEQVTGMAWLTGHEYDQPRIIRGPCDPIAGMHGAMALMLGLMERHRTDDAVFVESTMVEAALNCAAEAMVEFSAYGDCLERMGNRSPYAAPQNLYECSRADDWLALAVADNAQWEGLKAALGNPDWAEAPELQSARGRHAAHEMLDERLSRWAAEQNLSEAVEHLRSHGVAASGVYNTRLLFQHPQYAARGFYEPIEHPLAGELLLPTLPYSFRDSFKDGLSKGGSDDNPDGHPESGWLKRAAPMMGQDNHAVLGKLLNVSETEIADLEAKGVLATRPKGV